ASRFPDLKIFLLEAELRGKLKFARGQLVGDARKRLSEARPGCRAVSPRSAIADEVRMIENVERFRPHRQTVTVCKSKWPLNERIHAVNRPPAPRISRDYNSIYHRPIGGCACISAIVQPRHNIERQPRPKRSNASNADLTRRCVNAAQNETLPLIVNRAPFFLN